MEFVEFRFRVECVHLAGGARHEHEDAGFGFARDMSRPGRKYAGFRGRQAAVTLQQGRERQSADAVAKVVQQVASIQCSAELF